MNYEHEWQRGSICNESQGKEQRAGTKSHLDLYPVWWTQQGDQFLPSTTMSVMSEPSSWLLDYHKKDPVMKNKFSWNFHMITILIISSDNCNIFIPLVLGKHSVSLLIKVEMIFLHQMIFNWTVFFNIML